VQESLLEKETITELLRNRSIPLATAEDAASLLPDSAVAVLLYGSYARGDYAHDSDIDLLVLRKNPLGTAIKDRISLSFYTPDQMASAKGTLFGMHLARDGILLHDSDSYLRRLLDLMGQPVPEKVFSRIRHLAAVLDTLEDERARYLSGLIRIARYLLRTAIYVSAIEQGQPCFSVRELATRFNDPDLVPLLSSRADPTATISEDDLSQLVLRLGAIVGPFASNTHGSLRGLIVAEWFEDPDRATFGALILPRGEGAFDYAALQKVLL
jgi:predicted nucleotidyltransferase